MSKKYDKFNSKRPTWGYRVPLDKKNSLENLLANSEFSSKQELLDYLITFALEQIGETND